MSLFISAATALLRSIYQILRKESKPSRRSLCSTYNRVWYHFPFSWKHPACSLSIYTLLTVAVWVACDFPPVLAGVRRCSLLLFFRAYQGVPIQCSNSSMPQQCYTYVLAPTWCWLLLAATPRTCVCVMDCLSPQCHSLIVCRALKRYFYSDDILHTEGAHVYIYIPSSTLSRRRLLRGTASSAWERRGSIQPYQGTAGSPASAPPSKLPISPRPWSLPWWLCIDALRRTTTTVLLWAVPLGTLQAYTHVRKVRQFMYTGYMYAYIYIYIIYMPSLGKSNYTTDIVCMLYRCIYTL